MNHPLRKQAAWAAVATAVLLSTRTHAQTLPTTEAGRQLYEKVRPSLVAVKYTLDTELGRHELIFSGTVVSEDGLVMVPLAAVNENFPDEQLKDFKIIIIHDQADEEELDATFEGRDERSEVGFVKAKDARHWSPVHFENTPVAVGDSVLSVGLLPKAAGYRPYLMQGMVGAVLHDRVIQVLIGTGGLTTTGSPVFDAAGNAVGFVNFQPPFPMWLSEQNPLINIISPAKFMTPTSEFIQSLKDPPTAEKPVKLAWIGAMELTGLKKEEAEYFGLANQPAVQIGALAPGGPAEKAGIKQGDILVKVNGKGLERTDDPDDLPMLLRNELIRLPPGTKASFTVINDKDKKPHDLTITLEPRPMQPNVAKRFWAEDLGFGLRDLVFQDQFGLKLKPDEKGLIVTIVKPESAAATGHLKSGDLVTMLNGEAVTDLPGFKTTYIDFRKSHPKDAVVIVARRENHEETIRIEPPQ